MALLSFAACDPSHLDSDFQGDFDYGAGVAHEMIVLGRQLDDPYSLENMTKALHSVYPTKSQVVELEATNHYVRLLPRNDDDLMLLESMGVRTMDHPMDYQILQEGDYYHDPSIEEGKITWQYAVVSPDFKAPEGIECELLHKCFLAEPETTKAGMEWVDWDAVERESFRLTGNGDMLAPETKGKKKEAKIPRGRISIVDKDYDGEPAGVSGVQVSCNVFVRFDSCYTDEEGYYQMRRSFSSEPRYRLIFNNVKGFSVGMNAIFIKGSISTLGKHSPEGYNLRVTSASESKLFKRCAVNNAAYDYYESCSSNGIKIKTPPADLRIWLFGIMDSNAALMLHHGAILDFDLISDALGVYLPLVRFFLPDVILGTKNAKSYADLYHATQHELAHGSHFMNVGKSYWTDYAIYIAKSYLASGGVVYGSGTESDAGLCEVGEMWAYYVENVLFKERYPAFQTYFGAKYWFHPEIFTYLDRRGMNRFKIFQALDSGVTGKESLRLRLISLFPECRSMINEAFNNYR